MYARIFRLSSSRILKSLCLSFLKHRQILKFGDIPKKRLVPIKKLIALLFYPYSNLIQAVQQYLIAS